MADMAGMASNLSALSADYRPKPVFSSAHNSDQPDSQESNISTPPMKGSPMNKTLKDGSKWKEADLNKFGIHYDTGPISPYSIFLKVQNGGHAPSLLGSKRSNFLLQYAKHVEKLQAVFDEIFTLNQNSFELLEVRSLMNGYRHHVTNTGTSRPMPRSTEGQDLEDSPAHQTANDDDDEMVALAEVEEASAEDEEDCVDHQHDPDSASAISGSSIELDCPDMPEEGKTCNRNKAKFISRKIMNEIVRAQRSANHSQTEYVDMDFNESRLNVMRAIQQVDDFLDSLISVLANALSLDPEMNENTFVDLFQEFAKIFCVKFKSCGVKRYLKLGQLTITSRNDLRYDFAPAEDMIDNSDKKAVVTVAEVKQNVKRRDTGSTPPKKKLRSADSTPGSQSITSDSEKNESDIGSPDCLEFPPCLRGQHGIELLADLEHSCLEPTLTNSMILGMTVEATFVRLTCLDIQHNAFKKIQEKEPQNAVERIGTIYYTKAFDMLMRDGRKELIFIMRYLLFLSKNPSAKWLPRD